MKITVIGAGNVGATVAQMLATMQLANEVVLVDILEGIPQGKGLDIYESMPIWHSETRVIGTNNYEATKDSDIVIQTAGMARKPGMTRDDLLKINSEIVSTCIGNAFKYSPNAYYICVSNPVDVMTYVTKQVTGLPRHKVIGMAGVLDSARYFAFIAEELKCAVTDIHGLLLGGHGDTMVPLPRYTTISGIPLTDLMPKDKIDAIVNRAANGGAEIVGYLKTGSAYYAPAAATVEMVKSITQDLRRIMPCSVLLEGEYGHNDVVVGVPVMLGKNGIEKIYELDLNAEEKALFDNSAVHVAKTIKEAMEIIGSK